MTQCPQGRRMNIWVNKPQSPEGIGISRKMAINKLEVQRTGTLDACFGALHLRSFCPIDVTPLCGYSISVRNWNSLKSAPFSAQQSS